VPGRTAKEAIETFAGFMDETLSCLTNRRLLAHQRANNTYLLFYGEPVPLRSDTGARFYLQVTQVCNAVPLGDGTYKARTREYSYVFSESSELDHHGLVSYHWHPNDFNLRDPHLHLRITPQVGCPEIEHKLSKAHFPTSRVCLEDFVTLLLKYYDIKSPLHHSTYRSILKKNKTAFSKNATWTVIP
jgi:hypothetical protein